MNMRRRLSPEQTQENISRKGFEELLERHVWVTADVSPDLGEDIFVRIYDHGISTGITFYIQLKSTQDLEGLRLKSGDISYSFDVADLEHWEAQAVPVLLVTWDINTNQGCYKWVADAIQVLDVKKPNWRNQKSVKVHLPQSNVFDDAAFVKLRQELAKYFYPIVSKGKSVLIEASFEFPPTVEGKVKLAEFKKHLASGDSVEIEGEFITRFDLPDWWVRLFGQPEPSEMYLKLGPSKDTPIVPFQIDFISTEFGNVRLPHVELRAEKGGEKETTISNVHQETPINIRIINHIQAKKLEFNITLHFDNVDGYQAREAIRIQQILSGKSKMRIRNLENGNENTYTLPTGLVSPPLPSTVDFVDKVCLIQDELGILLRFPDDGTFSNKDEDIARQLISIFRTGTFECSDCKFTANFGKPIVMQCLPNLEEAKPLTFRISADESHVEILGKKIELGPSSMKVTGSWKASLDEVKQWIAEATEQGFLTIEMKQVESVEDFENWPRKSHQTRNTDI